MQNLIQVTRAAPQGEPAKTIKAAVHRVPGGENMMITDAGKVRYFTAKEAVGKAVVAGRRIGISSKTQSLYSRVRI